MVTLTTVAAEKVKGFLAGQDTAGLRVGVRGGGCSGFQYALALDEPKAEDRIFDIEGIRVIVDEDSLQYVDGSEVDYQKMHSKSGGELLWDNTRGLGPEIYCHAELEPRAAVTRRRWRTAVTTRSGTWLRK